MKNIRATWARSAPRARLHARAANRAARTALAGERSSAKDRRAWPRGLTSIALNVFLFVFIYTPLYWHETAAIHIQFDELLLPDGSVTAIDARITEVENARETVDKQGQIRGIPQPGPVDRAAILDLLTIAHADICIR